MKIITVYTVSGSLCELQGWKEAALYILLITSQNGVDQINIAFGLDRFNQV